MVLVSAFSKIEGICSFLYAESSSFKNLSTALNNQIIIIMDYNKNFFGSYFQDDDVENALLVLKNNGGITIRFC